MTQSLTEGYKVYTIGLNQILAIFHREANCILLFWKDSTIFTTFSSTLLQAGRTP
jgi:hypothetical protein